MDPYAMMLHYKRAFKLLNAMKQNSAKVLILGHLVGRQWKKTRVVKGGSKGFPNIP